jgi:hypothetical protein
MKTRWFAVVLTLNLIILCVTLLRGSSIATSEVAPVLRGRALEIVDDRGRVRAMIRVFPPSPQAKMPDGTIGYPETVLLRLIDSEGAPNVKIAATEDGSAISFGGESNPTNVQILARGDSTLLKMVNKDGRQQVIQPK